MRSFNVALTFLALAGVVLFGLTTTSTASAAVIGVSNGDFEDQTLSDPSFANMIDVWYDQSSSSPDVVRLDTGTGSAGFGAGSTNIWAGVGGWSYQQAGTWTSGEQVKVSGVAWRAVEHNFSSITLSLYVGSGSAADDTAVSSFATLLDSKTYTAADLSLTTSVSIGTKVPAGEGPASTPFSTTLDSGTSSTPGLPIWLEISDAGGSWVMNGVDDVVVVPEPSSLVLVGMGLLGLAFVAWRKRRSR